MPVDLLAEQPVDLLAGISPVKEPVDLLADIDPIKAVEPTGDLTDIPLRGAGPTVGEMDFKGVQAVQRGVETAKEAIPRQILKGIGEGEDTGDITDIPLRGEKVFEGGPIQSLNVKAGVATAAKLAADIGEFILLPSGKLKAIGKAISKVGEKVLGKAVGKAFMPTAERLPSLITKGAEFGALEPAATPREMALNTVEMGLFAGLIDVGIGGALAYNIVNKLAKNAKLTNTPLPTKPEAVKEAVKNLLPLIEKVQKTLQDKEAIYKASINITRKEPRLYTTKELSYFQSAGKKAEIGGDVPKIPAVQEKVPAPPKPPEVAPVGETKGLPKIEEGKIAAGGIAPEAPLPKYAGSVNLERVGADYSVKRLILDAADRYKGTINEARRGIITHKETRKMADELGLSVRQLLKRKKGQAFNAEEILGFRDVLNTSARQLKEAQTKAMAGGDAEMAQFKLQFDLHAAIQAEVSGISTEAGRALSAHRIKSAKSRQVQKNYKAMLDVLGGRDITSELLSRLSKIDPENQIAVNKFIRQSSQATITDMIFEAWVNALLSSPVTQVVNNVSNTLVALTKIPEKLFAISIEALRAGITKTPKERFFGEVPAHIFGARHGLKEGVRKAIEVFKIESPFEISKLDIRPEKYASIPSKVFREGIAKKKIKIGDKEFEVPFTGEIQIGGKQVRIPGRVLMAMDSFFKTINYEAELYSLAYRQASKEGLKGAARVQRTGELISNPPENFMKKASEEMLYRVFQKDLGSTGKVLQKLREKAPGLRYVIPFLRTPINIAKFGLERTPLNYPRIFRDILKGKLKGGEISDELAKTTMGSTVGAAVYMYAKDGLITGGGPRNRTERDALYRTGWQPYSLKIGNQYYYYGRLEPLGMIVGLAADASEIVDVMDSEDPANIASLIVVAISKNLLNKTFMLGLSSIFNAISDPSRYGERWVRNFGGTIVPTGIATFSRALDPIMKNPETFIDSLTTRIPWMADDIPPRRDLWGEPITRGEGGFVERMISPVYRSKVGGDKINEELVRLGLHPGPPKPSISGASLDPEQYDRYLEITGKRTKKRLDKYAQSAAYKSKTDEAKAESIKRIMRDERKKTRKYIIEFYKLDIKKKTTKKKTVFPNIKREVRRDIGVLNLFK